MPTPLYPTFEKRINDATHRIIENQVTPWAFLKSNQNFNIKQFDGREIHYGLPSYEGSPQLVFWGGYIDPFLEDMAEKEISEAVSLASERKIDLKLLLPEVEGLLLSSTRKVLDRMTDIDQRLRGNGFPENVRPRSTEREFDRMRQFISVRASSELAMWKPKSSIEDWYERNKFIVLIFTTIFGSGTLFAVANLILKFFEKP